MTRDYDLNEVAVLPFVNNWEKEQWMNMNCKRCHYKPNHQDWCIENHELNCIDCDIDRSMRIFSVEKIGADKQEGYTWACKKDNDFKRGLLKDSNGEYLSSWGSPYYKGRKW